MDKIHDFSRKHIAVDIGDMQLMDNSFFFAKDDVPVDVYFACGSSTLHYKIVHVCEEPFDKTWVRVRTDRRADTGYIEIANYRHQKIHSITNFEPIKIAEGPYSYYIHMTVTRVANNGKDFQKSPNEINLWNYAIALYYEA